MAKLDRNLANYISVQHSWNLSRLLGLITCSKLANNIYLEASSLKWANNVPKLLGVDYVAKKLSGTSHVVKSFAFGSFLKHWKNKWLSPLKIVKTASQINAEPIDFLQNLPRKFPQNWWFLPIISRHSLPQKVPRKSCKMGWVFHQFFTENPAKFHFFPWPIRSPELYTMLQNCQKLRSNLGLKMVNATFVSLFTTPWFLVCKCTCSIKFYHPRPRITTQFLHFCGIFVRLSMCKSIFFCPALGAAVSVSSCTNSVSMLVISFDWRVFPYYTSRQLIGSLSNDDGDCNKNGKKAIGLDWQNNNFAHASCFLVHFFAVAAQLQRETT